MMASTVREGSFTRVMTRELRSSPWPWITAIVLVGTGLGLLLYGLDFYRLGLVERVEHEAYEALSPTGVIGQGYGVVGTALFLANLLYLVRRRLARLPLGSMRAWLNAHVLTGLTGSLLIVFHSAFQLRTPIALATSASLGLVVGTGIVGRWLVAISPRPDPQKLAASLLALDQLIPGVAGVVREELRERPIPTLAENASFVRTFASVPSWIRGARARRKIVRNAWHEVTRPRALTREELRFARRLAKQAANMAAGEVRSVAAAAVLRSWRAIHRLFALLMVFFVSVHIGVAWFYGYRWIFSG